MGGYKGQSAEFKLYPKYKDMYIRAFERMLKYRHEHELDGVGKQNWETGEDVFNWWLHGGNGYLDEKNNGDYIAEQLQRGNDVKTDGIL